MERTVSKFKKKFIRNYDEDSDKGDMVEAGVKYPKRLHDFFDLPFSLDKVKINKCNKLVCSF